MLATQQLALNISLKDGFRFVSFYTEDKSPNSETLGILKSIVDSKEPQQNILWGESQSGKTHLLQACCAKEAEAHHTVSYIPLKVAANSGIDILTGLSQSHLIALDDIDSVLKDKTWETALFNLINITRENGQNLLLSSSKNPRMLDCILPDLASRLIWGGSYQLHTLSDDEKPKAIQARAQQRGFELTDRVIEYLYRRYPRDIESLMQMLDTLDKESLRQKTVITIPFAKQILENL